MNVDEEDLSQEIFPLSHYATNRSRLINEAFNVLRGHRLESTIPPALRHLSYPELKAICVKELEKIDTLRIVDIIEGRIVSTTNDDDQGDSSGLVRKRKSTQIPTENHKKKKREEEEDDGDDDDDENDDEEGSSPAEDVESDPGDVHGIPSSERKKTKKKKKKKKLKKLVEGNDKSLGKKKSKSHKVKSKSKVKKLGKKLKRKSVKKGKNVEQATSSSGDVGKPIVLTGERTLMELLELEYRAKAIKALLKFQGFRDTKLDELFHDSSSDQGVGNSLDSSHPTTATPKISQHSQKAQENQKISPDTKMEPTPAVPDPLTTSSPTRAISKGDAVPPPVESSTCSPEVEPTVEQSPPPPQPRRDAESDPRFELSIDIDDDLEDYDNLGDPPPPVTPPPALPPPEHLCQEESRQLPKSALQCPPKQSVELEADDEGRCFKRRRVTRYPRQPRLPSSDSESDTNHLNLKCKSQGSKTTSSESSDLDEEGPAQVGSNPKNIPENPNWCSTPKSASEEGELGSSEGLDDDHDHDVEPVSSAEEDTLVTSSDIAADSGILESKIQTPATPPPPTTEDVQDDEPRTVGDIDAIPISEYPPPSPHPGPEADSLNKRRVPRGCAHDPDADSVNVNIPQACAQDPEDADESGDVNNPQGSSQNVLDEEDSFKMPQRYPEEATPVTWYERWYSSKKVQKVVNSTKIYGKLRSKLKTAAGNKIDNSRGLEQQQQQQQLPHKTEPRAEPDVPIIGSIEEYEKLFGKKILAQNLDRAPSPPADSKGDSSGGKSTGPTRREHDDQDEDEDDDDDDDELWGDILGKP